MGVRVGLLTGLLVVALGSGTVAQEPSPEPIPLYAPDDLASALPAYLGEWRMDIVVYEGLEYLEQRKLQTMAWFGGRPAWHEVLRQLGKDLSDVHLAGGLPIGDPRGLWGGILVFRVEGVPGATLLDGLLAAAAAGMVLPDEVLLDDAEWSLWDEDGDTDTGLRLVDEIVIDGKEVAVLEDPWAHLDPVYGCVRGELLYLLRADGPDAPSWAEILASLPQQVPERRPGDLAARSLRLPATS